MIKAIKKHFEYYSYDWFDALGADVLTVMLTMLIVGFLVYTVRMAAYGN